MLKANDTLTASLATVRTFEDFDAWDRQQLRYLMPHAALLVTIGRLYGVGSVPTHRIGVDFPLNMVEALKNRDGALDDPLIYGWFRSEKPRHVQIADLSESGGQHRWRAMLTRYGIKGMTIHGVLEHTARRFAIFQFCNLCGRGSPQNMSLLSSLVKPMAEAVWGATNNRFDESTNMLVGHPTIKLTAAELHIIELLAQGLSNKEIARRRGVSDSTIKTQMQRTGAKLGATRRAEIVAIAMPMLSPLPAQGIIDYNDFN